MPKSSSISSAPSVSGGSWPRTATSRRHHDDPALYTALFRRKVVKVFTGWQQGFNVSIRRKASRNGLKKATSSAGANHGDLDGEFDDGRRDEENVRTVNVRSMEYLHGGKSPCLINGCLECDDREKVNGIDPGSSLKLCKVFLPLVCLAMQLREGPRFEPMLVLSTETDCLEACPYLQLIHHEHFALFTPLKVPSLSICSSEMRPQPI